jgi:uracil-DNA glycosylase family 4
MLIGEAPGEREHQYGRPFVGMSGKVLDSVLYSCSLSRDSLYITNLYKSWPGPGNPSPTAEQIASHSGLLQEELETVRPRVIGTLGAYATKHFLGDVYMEDVHGLTFTVTLGGREVVIVPIYHPAAGLHSPEVMVHCFRDMMTFARVLKLGKAAVVPRVDQYPDPSYMEIDKPCHMPPGTAVAIDTEGWVHDPWCLTFSANPGTGGMIRATNKEGLLRFREFIHDKLVILHHSLHDLPVLRAMGIYIRPDQFVDTMVLSYLTQLEPQGLKSLAYRHAAMEMDSYESLTAEAEDDLIGNYLVEALSQVYPKQEPVQEWRGGVYSVRQPASLETLIASALRSWVKGTKRPSKWLREMDPAARDIMETVNGEVPRFTLDMVPPEKVLHYACRDADATIRVWPKLEALIQEKKLEDIREVDHAVLGMADFMQSKGMPADKVGLVTYAEQLRDDLTTDAKRMTRLYSSGKPFNPNSSDQCAHLLFDVLGLASTRLTKSRKKLSTDDKALKALLGYHPAVKEIDDWREKDKIRQFAEQLAAAVTNGRVPYSIKVTRVVSGRYATADENLMAIPVRSDMGKELRKRFKAPPGWLLGSCDLSQIELRIMAHLSQDPRMLKVFHDGRDMHSETAMNLLGCPESAVKDKKYRTPAKFLNFGIGYGITEQGFYEQLVVAGVYSYSVADCAELIRDWYKVYHGVARAQELAGAETRKNGYVRDMGGRIRYLPNIHSPFPWLKAEAERQAFNHKVQASATWVMKRGMARFWKWLTEERRLEHIWPLLQIHDDMVTQHKIGSDATLARVLPQLLTADASLFSVPILAEYHSGPSWGDL